MKNQVQNLNGVRARLIIPALLGVALATACSSSSGTGGATCGAGTALVGNECVAGDGGMAADTGMTSTDGSTRFDSSDGAGGLEGGTADDPCPAATINVDCSTTCGGPNAACANAQCGADFAHNAIVISEYSQLPLVLRTPHVSGANSKCPNCPSPADSVPNGMVIRVSLLTPGLGVVARTSAPWIVALRYSHDICPSPSTATCLYDKDQGDIVIYSHDLNAPSRNVVIEEVFDAGSPCP